MRKQNYFLVYGEKKLEKIEEEKREYNPDKKMKLDFSMDRSKNTTKNILKDSKMSKGEVKIIIHTLILWKKNTNFLIILYNSRKHSNAFFKFRTFV